MILVGIEKNGNRVNIKNYDNNLVYCQGCGSELIAAKGSIYQHHYKHKTLNDCDYGGKTLDHINFQLQFPDECVEYVLYDINGDKHIADVKYNNTIIEYQHSNIEIDEVIKRTNFYTKNHELYWVFDRRKKFLNFNNKIYDLGGGKYELEYDYKTYQTDNLLFNYLKELRNKNFNIKDGKINLSKINICIQYSDEYIFYPTNINGNIFTGWRFTINSLRKHIESNEKKYNNGKRYFIQDDMISLFD